MYERLVCCLQVFSESDLAFLFSIMERLCSAPRQMPAVDFRQCVIAEAGDGVLPSRTSYSACIVKGVQSTEIDNVTILACQNQLYSMSPPLERCLDSTRSRVTNRGP